MLLVGTFTIDGQEIGEPTETAPAEPEEPAEDPRPLFDRTLVSDVTTAELSELLDWAATLGLSTRGNRTDVENRILRFYGVEREAEIDAAEESSDGDGDGDAESPPERSIARIERARESDFFEVEAVGEDYLRLVGGVVMTMIDGESTHRIEAEQITLNLATDTLAARGSVVYELSREDGGGESFRGESVVFQIDTWDGVFINGITERSEDLEEGDVDFSVQGDRISRSPNEIIVIDEGSITSSPATPPNYRIRARRIWLLAPGEWGFRRATLYVGRIPSFYLPVFFLPGDRLFFNPSVGSKERAGGFIQTTTYIYGQSEEREPPISIMQLGDAPEDRDREIRGLFLRVPDEPLPPDPDDWTWKVMFDIYSVLGGYVGTELSLPDLGPFRSLDARVGLGASRNIYLVNGLFTSYYIDDDGRARSYWNRGNLFGLDTPYRFETTIDAAARGSTWSVDGELELYSDPQFRRDFGDRSEGMDWSFILNSAVEDEESLPSTVSSLVWRARGSWRPRVPALAPLVSSIAITPIVAQLNFRTETNANLPAAVDRGESDGSPEDSFFYPQSLVLPQIGARIDGTIATWPRPVGRNAGAAPDRSRSEPDDGDVNDEEDRAELIPPWSGQAPPGEPAAADFRLPELVDDAPGITDPSDGSLSIRYSLTPSLRYDRFTTSDDWDEPDDISLDWLYSTLQLRSSGSITTTVRSRDRIAEVTNKLGFDLRYQSFDPGSGLSDDRRASLREDSRRFRQVTADQDSALTVRPLAGVPRLGDSSLGYRIDSEVYALTYAEESDGYESRFAEWRIEDITTHQANVDLRVDALGDQQRIEARAALPPRDGLYRGSLRLRTGPITSTASGGITDDEEEGWTPDPLVQSHTVSVPGDAVSLTQRLDYDLEQAVVSQSVTSLSLWIVEASLNGRRTTGVSFDPATGWQEAGGERFRWATSRLTIDADRTYRFWRRRVDVTLIGRADVTGDLQQFTGSSLELGYGVEISIHEFLDFELAARSRNDSIYQYVPSLARQVDRPTRNLGADLVDSFRLFDRTARETSFFKIDSLEATAVHDLQDWELRLSYRGRPELDTVGGQSVYRWQSEVALLVRWRSISELRRNLEITDGTVEFLP